MEYQKEKITTTVLFIITIAMAVASHNLLHLPPVIGMMTGLGLLKLFGYYLQRRDQRAFSRSETIAGSALGIRAEHAGSPEENARFYNIYNNLKRAEWDTLLFFYGVVLCVGGLGFIDRIGRLAKLLLGRIEVHKASVEVSLTKGTLDEPMIFAGAFDGENAIAQIMLAESLANAIDGGQKVAS